MRFIFNRFSLLLFLLLIGLHPQIEAQNKKTLSKIPVVVSDRDGRRIPGLSKEDFAIYQNGERQNIAYFATEEEPVSVALLLDTSGSTEEILNKIKKAAEDFIELLQPEDKCLIATFDSKLNILIPFTSNKEELKKSLNKIQTAEHEGTVMLNAIDQISQKSFDRIQGRKAIILLSDGKDFGSSISRRDLLNELEESDVSIYSIYYQSGPGFNQPVVTSNSTVEEGKEIETPKKVKKPKKKKGVYTVLIPLPGNVITNEDIKLIDKTATTDAISSLKEFSDLTAGGFYMSDTEKLSAVLKQVAAELREQYLIGFYSNNASVADITQDVTIKVNRPGVVVRTRTKLQP